ncbi:MAG: hypothetical protein WA030_02315 [Candidatus Microsaccharimonas sp.]
MSTPSVKLDLPEPVCPPAIPWGVEEFRSARNLQIPRNVYLIVLFGIITYLSTKLWSLPSYGSILGTVLVFVTIGLGIITILLFVKIFTTKRHLLDLLGRASD